MSMGHDTANRDHHVPPHQLSSPSTRTRRRRLTARLSALAGGIALLGLGLQTASAYLPDGWVYFTWPYAYELTSGTWRFFNNTNTQWAYGYPPAGGWGLMSTNELSTGWSYFSWPFAYDSDTNAWFYLNEADTMWCYNLSNGVWSKLGEVEPPPAPPGYPHRQYDFDGDNGENIATYERDWGLWRIRSPNGSTRTHFLGDAASTPVPGDYDGDGITDVAVFKQSIGRWTVLQSSTITEETYTLGDPDSVPVQADYDGDGITDMAVYVRSTGDWDIRQSKTGTLRLVKMGSAFHRPVPADYDGDGKDDPAIYWADTGQWSIRQSSNGQTIMKTLGGPEYRPVPGYYDTDAKADLAVFDPQIQEWRILRSTSGSVRILTMGDELSVAVPGDYDGDGRTDPAIYNPDSGWWQWISSINGNVGIALYGDLLQRAVPAYSHGAIENLRIHCHGDSITYGQGSSSDGPATGYPDLLERRLEGAYGGDIVSLNYGKPGETSGKGLARLQSQLPTSDARVLLIMEGTNDHFFQGDFDGLEANLRAMVEEGLSRGMYVVIATIPPVIPADRPDQQSRIVAFNPRIYDIAADYHIPVAPVYEFITSVPNWDSLLMDQATGNHPNDDGYQYVRDAFLSALDPAMVAAEVY